jgi:hypothetical protein
MARYEPPAQLCELLEPFDPELRRLALRTRMLVLDVLAPCCETICDACNAVALGNGSTERMKDFVVHVGCRVHTGEVATQSLSPYFGLDPPLGR